jgi:hypothetical protein
LLQNHGKERSPKEFLQLNAGNGRCCVTLPYLQDFRNLPKSVQIDLLTRNETDPFKNLLLFNNVFLLQEKEV